MPLVTNGKGLYRVSHSNINGTTNDEGFNKDEYRYAGTNPNNYVEFNNEIWRIIGLVYVKTENGVEQRLKIIRFGGLLGQKNFGNHSWDHKLTSIGSSLSDNGSNDWTDSELKDMLNGIYCESSSGDC